MNIRFLSAALVFSFLAALPFGSSYAADAAASGPKIAVVDLQRLMTESKAGQDIQAQLNSRRDAFQKEVAAQEKKLSDTEASLEKMMQDKKAAADFSKKKAEFEKSLSDTRQSIQKKRGALEKTANDGIADLRNSAVEAIAEISDKEKIDIVLLRQGVIMANKEMDITDEAMKALNAKISKVTLKFEAAE